MKNPKITKMHRIICSQHVLHFTPTTVSLVQEPRHTHAQSQCWRENPRTAVGSMHNTCTVQIPSVSTSDSAAPFSLVFECAKVIYGLNQVYTPCCVVMVGFCVLGALGKQPGQLQNLSG